MATAPSSRLLWWSAARGCQVAWGPMRLIETALAGLDARLDARELDAAFALGNLAFGARSEPDRSRDWRLLVVVAPSPAHVVTFQLSTGQVDTLLPPTYVSYRASFETMRQELAAGPLADAQVRTLDAPLKSIASCLGLVRYGRNNVTYAERLGSWIQLFGYMTDADLPLDDAWQPQAPALLDECDVCGVCEARCPTGAVSGARVLLHAERCLTLANESPGEWPAWVPTGAHECLAGCLACQRACPANPPLPVEDSGFHFTEAETAVLLAEGQPDGPALASARRRLEQLGLSFGADIIGRNLRALLLARELQTT